MSDEKSVLLGGDLEYLRGGQSDHSLLRCRREVYRTFAAADRQNNVEVQISIGLEADQGRGSPGSDAPA